MIRVLYIPASNDSMVQVDVDNENFAEYKNNPYFIAGDIIGKDNQHVMTERVRTSIITNETSTDYHMFVDEAGAMIGLPMNSRVSYRLYPGQIFGDVMLTKLELVHTDEGPDFELIDHDWSAFMTALDN